MANRVAAIDITKKAPDRKPQGVNTCRGQQNSYKSPHLLWDAPGITCEAIPDEMPLYTGESTETACMANGQQHAEPTATHLASGQGWCRGNQDSYAHPKVENWRRRLRRYTELRQSYNIRDHALGLVNAYMQGQHEQNSEVPRLACHDIYQDALATPF